MPEKQETIKALVAIAKKNGLSEDDFDETVATLKDSERASINNSGMEAQLEYITDCNGVQWTQDFVSSCIKGHKEAERRK